jgi:hypothetical protein
VWAVDGNWLGQIDSGAAKAMSDAPSWLQARPGRALHMVRGGTGYAVLPPSSAACAQTLEIVSASGKVCGDLTFSSSASSCNYATVRVGYDGTVILGASLGSNQCSWEWWPGEFR